MFVDAAYLGNVLLFLLVAAFQFGGIDDLFDDEEDEGETGFDLGPTYDPTLYDQELFGTAGPDVLTLASGDPSSGIFLGAGDDSVDATDSADHVDGGAGDDILILRGGNDIGIGGDGDDDLFAGLGNDSVYGGAGNDTVDGSLGDDVIYGGSGNDQIEGARDNDVIYGGAGNDVISGDRLDGIGGVDRGTDILYGEDGDDTLWLYGADTGTGGAGADLFRVINADDPDTGVTITDYDAAEDMIQIHYADGSAGVPSVSIAAVDGTDDVQILLDAQTVATVTGGAGLVAEDVVLTAVL